MYVAITVSSRLNVTCGSALRTLRLSFEQLHILLANVLPDVTVRRVANTEVLREGAAVFSKFIKFPKVVHPTLNITLKYCIIF